MDKEKEIEVKFKLENVDTVREKLKSLGGIPDEKIEQKTFSLFDRFRFLSRKGIFIRTRKDGDKSTFTIKTRNLELQSQYAERNEFNVSVEDAEAVAEMLKLIGLEDLRILQKYREQWHELGEDVDVVIDYTPIGEFIEIEGEKKSIDEFIDAVGLGDLPRITQAYWDVYRDSCKDLGVDEKNDLVF